MNKLKVFVIVLVLISFKTFACLNGDTKVLENKLEIYHDEHTMVPLGHRFDGIKFPELISELDSLYRKTNNINYLSDKGYVLIIDGKYQEALQLYLNIEKIKPNRYSTASNLGTLYELMGENQKAYDWIKKSVQINPESHNGSEWLHLKILEAKIKNLKDVSGQFLINSDFGLETIPKTKLLKIELEKLRKALYYQLNERITFIKPKDHIISVLLFELGNAAKIKGDYRSALDIYELSKKYGLQSELLNDRIILCYEDFLAYCGNENENLNKKSINLRHSKFDLDGDEINQVVISLIITSVFALILLIAFIILYFKWKELKRASYSQ
jgi:tetratricopeptide (TPR) repeat protein